MDEDVDLGGKWSIFYYFSVNFYSKKIDLVHMIK